MKRMPFLSVAYADVLNGGGLDVVVHPSHSENVGGAAESLLLGIPTVATEVGGFPDLVHPGETGWLVPARSPQDLANAILDALNNPAHSKEMAQKGQLLAQQIFDVKGSAQEIYKIYETVLGKGIL